MPDREEILRSADPTLADAGRQGMRTCLAAGEADTVTVVTDEECLPVGAAFLGAANEIGATTHGFIVEHYCPRPTSRFPEQILDVLASSTVTVLAMFPKAGELKARLQVIELVPERLLRHAHLVAVSVEAIRQGLRADYHAIDVLQDRILAVLKEAGGVLVTSANGTSLEATFEPTYRWAKSNGLIQPGEWQNLPSGQVYTCPGTIHGTYVADVTLGDWFDERYPDLSKHPVRLEIAEGRLTNAVCDNRKLARELSLFVRSSENGDRIGELGIGTNPFLSSMVGQTTNNEDVPGVHVAIGNPLSQKTGADWTSKVRVPFVGRGMTIIADTRTIMEDGRFSPDLLEGLPSLQAVE